MIRLVLAVLGIAAAAAFPSAATWILAGLLLIPAAPLLAVLVDCGDG